MRLQEYGKQSGMIIYHIIVTDVNIMGTEKLIVELSLMVKLMPWLEVGEKDDEGTIKDLQGLKRVVFKIKICCAKILASVWAKQC
ncbi:hypothetical protein RDI58_005504 [Solanum bulbocastanum]|uniref:Uncharacterized protein n=1 Tax=Solanum bulbocastanum TaxID=147425 RepID=A0AAN8YMM0_SOLBU